MVTRGWNGYRNKSQHRKSTTEKKILPPFQQGFEPATFQSRVRCSNHWAIPAPLTVREKWFLSLYFLLYTEPLTSPTPIKILALHLNSSRESYYWFKQKLFQYKPAHTILSRLFFIYRTYLYDWAETLPTWLCLVSSDMLGWCAHCHTDTDVYCFLRHTPFLLVVDGFYDTLIKAETVLKSLSKEKEKNKETKMTASVLK